jgi:hypothetical protein
MCVMMLHSRYDVIMVDQVSACVPLLRLSRAKVKTYLLCVFLSAKKCFFFSFFFIFHFRCFFFSNQILFYCHFPDLLLTERRSFQKRMYRLVMDYIEEKTTGRQILFIYDFLFVNSQTLSIFFTFQVRPLSGFCAGHRLMTCICTNST